MPNAQEGGDLTLEDYQELAAKVPRQWSPNPFTDHPGGAWHGRVFPTVVSSLEMLLDRFDRGEVTEWQLLHGKDNDRRKTHHGRSYCHDVFSHWLYFQHHPGDERWKLLGQRYWSVNAWLSWRDQYFRTPRPMRLNRRDQRYHLRTFPKRGVQGLRSEHVVPKTVLKKQILGDRLNLAAWLRNNLCCVVTIEENSRLVQNDHPDPTNPWLRYSGKGIILLHNPGWTPQEIAPLLEHELLTERSTNPLPIGAVASACDG